MGQPYARKNLGQCIEFFAHGRFYCCVSTQHSFLRFTACRAAKYDGVWHWANDYSPISGDYGAKMGSAGKLHAMARPIQGMHCALALHVQDKTSCVLFISPPMHYMPVE
jgi:hypothetical protein